MKMSALDFRRAHTEIGWTGAKLAREMDVSPETVSRWRNGSRPVTGPAVLAMKALATGWRP